MGARILISAEPRFWKGDGGGVAPAWFCLPTVIHDSQRDVSVGEVKVGEVSVGEVSVGEGGDGLVVWDGVWDGEDDGVDGRMGNRVVVVE